MVVFELPIAMPAWAAAAAAAPLWHSPRGKLFWLLSPINSFPSSSNSGLLKFDFLATRQLVGWRQDNGNGSNQESKFDFLATP